MEFTKDYLTKLLISKDKLAKAVNIKLVELIQPTVLEAISKLTNTPQSSFQNIDVYGDEDTLMVQLEAEIDGALHSLRVGIPMNIVFNDVDDIFMFMKQMSEEDEQQPALHIHDTSFDLSNLSQQQQLQLKYSQKSMLRH